MSKENEWRAQQNGSGSWDVVQVINTKHDWEEVRFIAIAQSEVDAHRIAASLDMQQALDEIAAETDRCLRIQGGRTGNEKYGYGLIEAKARAALTKSRLIEKPSSGCLGMRDWRDEVQQGKTVLGYHKWSHEQRNKRRGIGERLLRKIEE